MTCRCNITKRDNADQPLLAVHDRQATDLLLGHVLGHVLQLFVLEDVADLGCHHISDLGARRVTTFCGQTHGDVSIADHADKAIALCNRQDADIGLTHRARRLLHHIVWANKLYFSLHDIGNALRPITAARGLSLLVLRHPLLQRFQRLFRRLPHSPNDGGASL